MENLKEILKHIFVLLLLIFVTCFFGNLICPCTCHLMFYEKFDGFSFDRLVKNRQNFLLSKFCSVHLCINFLLSVCVYVSGGVCMRCMLCVYA